MFLEETEENQSRHGYNIHKGAPGPNWELNLETSCCEVTVLPTRATCRPLNMSTWNIAQNIARSTLKLFISERQMVKCVRSHSTTHTHTHTAWMLIVQGAALCLTYILASTCLDLQVTFHRSHFLQLSRQSSSSFFCFCRSSALFATTTFYSCKYLRAFFKKPMKK